ncbi:MAG: segregation/condensation protein A, partial [Acutalibacteraceae bacterium]|nr:segregation/condensation protein A [Acutalibacteraceae bacterium]
MEIDALSFKIDVFEGPLDLLLTLISKNKLNIYDIPISLLVDQYIEQINRYKEQNAEIASEFLTMAARLIYIKTAQLLPKYEDEGEQLKAELTGELIEYQTCKEMANKLSQQTDGFNLFVREPSRIDPDKTYKRQHEKEILLKYYMDAVGRGKRRLPPPVSSFSGIVSKKIVSVSSRIVHVLRRLYDGKRKSFRSLFDDSRSRSE